MNFDASDLQSLEEYLRSNNISKTQICLVGSTTLSLIGIRKHSDIDIVIHSNINTKNLISHQFIEKVNSPWSTLFSDDKLIEDSNLHIIYNGFKFIRPELVFHRKIWHNRRKDQVDISQLREYAKKSKIWNWQLIDRNLPKPFFVKQYFRFFFDIFLYNYHRILEYLHTYKMIHKDCFQMIPTSHLFAKQIVNQVFNRYDVVIRYMAISSFLNGEDRGVSLYKKMQTCRASSIYKNPWKEFQELIINFKENGFDLNEPILVNSDLHIVDGSHRLACALYFQEPFVPVRINKKLSFALFGLNWFESFGFTNTELKLIEKQRLSIFDEQNIFFEVVLWPTVLDYFDEIEEFISKRYKIIASVDYKAISDFDTYIKALYKIDDIKQWKVDLKIEAMSAYPKDIRVIKIEILEPNYRYKDNNRLISIVVEELKQEIRNKYKSKVKNYFHDIIIHIGDNYEHSRLSKGLISK